jgi:hypothetical protein
MGENALPADGQPEPLMVSDALQSVNGARFLQRFQA